jgi:hypothetical protein
MGWVSFTNVPHLLKGRVRDDICFGLVFVFLGTTQPVILNRVKELRSLKANFFSFHECPSPAEGQGSE